MRAILIIMLCFAVGAVGWYAGSQQGKPSPSDQSESGTSDARSDSVASVHGLGKLEPFSGIVKIFAPRGQKIDSLFEITVGQAVKKDATLVKLGGQEIRQAELDLATAREADAKQKLEYERRQGEFKKRAAQLALEEALAAREAVDSKRKNIELLKKQRQAAQENTQRLQGMLASQSTKRLVNRADLDKQKLLVEQLEIQIEQAKLEIKLAAAQAERAYKAAEIDLQTVNFVIEESEMAVPSNTLTQAINAAKLAIEMTEIKSPMDATVLDIIVQPGDTATTQPVMLLGDVSKMACIAEINDTQMKHVNVGNRVKITSPAFDQAIWGKVDSKGIMIGPPSIQDPNPFGSVDRATGKVVVLLDDSEVAKKFVNLQVDVEIEVTGGSLEQ